MKQIRLFLVLLTLTAVTVIGPSHTASAAGSTVTTPDGGSVAWADWLGDNAPIAVLLWASWVPDADSTLADLDRITAAASARGLELVLVVVQEPLNEARESLGNIDVEWLHDRYGHLLKEYRVVSIPRLLVVAEDGRVVERLEVDVESLRAWGGE